MKKRAKRAIIAGFKCPVCNSPVKAHGFTWKCTRPNCVFTSGRKWKSDPYGYWLEKCRRDYYRPYREQYLKEKKGDVEK